MATKARIRSRLKRLKRYVFTRFGALGSIT